MRVENAKETAADSCYSDAFGYARGNIYYLFKLMYFVSVVLLVLQCIV
jgi:hypothetical protein